MSRSDLPKVKSGSSTTLNHPESGENDTKKKTLSGEESSPSNSVQPTKREDPKQIAPSHPKLVAALSRSPYSPLFGILWPIIIEQASFDTRDLLREVDPYFEKLCRPHSDSDLAKRCYVSYSGKTEQREGLPYVLDLSFGVEWRSWGADKCGFNSPEVFRTFCALGDVDPDQGRSWEPYASRNTARFVPPSFRYIWMSRTKDVVFETMMNPLTESGYCHYFGLTGVADKAIAMYNFMHDNHNYDPVDEYEVTTVWSDLGWEREYI